MHLKGRTQTNKHTKFMLCMHNCLYFMANKYLCFDVVAFAAYLMLEQLLRECSGFLLSPAPFRSETPLVDAHPSFFFFFII